MLSQYDELLYSVENEVTLSDEQQGQYHHLQESIFRSYIANPELLLQELFRTSLSDTDYTDLAESTLEYQFALLEDIIQQRPDLINLVIPADRLPTAPQTAILSEMIRLITPKSVTLTKQFEQVDTGLRNIYRRMISNYFERLLDDYDRPVNLGIGLHNTLLAAWQTLNWRSVGTVYEIFNTVIAGRTIYEKERDGRAILPFNDIQLRELEHIALSYDLKNIANYLNGFSSKTATKIGSTYILDALNRIEIYDQVLHLIGRGKVLGLRSVIFAGLTGSHQLYSELARKEQQYFLGIEHTNTVKKRFLSLFHPRDINSLLNTLARFKTYDDPIVNSTHMDDPELHLDAIREISIAGLVAAVQSIDRQPPAWHPRLAVTITEQLARAIEPGAGLASVRELLRREQELRELHQEMDRNGFHTVSRRGDRFSATRNPHLLEMKLDSMEFKRLIRYMGGDPENGISFAGYFIDLQLAESDILLQYFLSDDDRLLLNINYYDISGAKGYAHECLLAPVWESALKYLFWEHIASIRLGDDTDTRSRTGKRIAIASTVEAGSIVTPYLRLNQSGHSRTSVNEEQMLHDGYFTMLQLETMEAAHPGRSVSYVREHTRGDDEGEGRPREMVLHRGDRQYLA